MREFISVLAGIVLFVGYIPYVRAILRGETKPAKASWIIWGSLDVITLVGMYLENALNGQICGATAGAFTVVFLAFRYGTPGWTRLDRFCLGGAAVGVLLWYAFDDPVLGIVTSQAVVLLASFPTFRTGWNNPAHEDTTAWTFYWASCVLAVLAIPAWTLEDAVQPFNFLIINSVMMYLLRVRPYLLGRTNLHL